MIFQDLINEMPKSSDHKDLFRVFNEVPGSPSKYIEDLSEDAAQYRDALQMIEVLTIKMMANPLLVDRLKKKIDILTSISEHPKYWDSSDKAIFKINNSNLLYNHDDYICFNDKFRNYPVMYIDKNFLEMDTIGNLRWLISPSDMRDYFQKIMSLPTTVGSMSFIRAVGPECESMQGINMFQYKASVICLLPMTRDFLDFYDHIIFNDKSNIMSKFYKMLVMFLDYMFDVYNTEGDYIGSDMYRDKGRFSIVLAGYGAVGIKNCCFTSSYFFQKDASKLRDHDKRFFENTFLNDMVRTDLNLSSMLEEAYVQIMGPQHLVPSYGIVKVAENYSVIEDCDICLEHHENLLDKSHLKGRILPTGDYELKYGILSTVARNKEDAVKCISTYMLDCPYITDVKVSDDIISVDKTGKEITKSRINNKKMTLQNIYKKRRRVFDFSRIEKAPRDDGLGEYIVPSSFQSVRVHDEFGRKLVSKPSVKLFDDSFVDDDNFNTSDTVEYSSDNEDIVEYPNYDFKDITESGSKLVDTEDLESMLGLVSDIDGLGLETVSSSDASHTSNYDKLSLSSYDVKVPLNDLVIEKAHVYWYAISFKRMIYNVGVECGLTEKMLNIMVKGGFVYHNDLPGGCLDKLRNFKVFQIRGNKLSISSSYSLQVSCILDLFVRGVIRLHKSDDGGYVWKMINDTDDCLEIISF